MRNHINRAGKEVMNVSASVAGAEWRHPPPLGPGGSGVRKGFLGLVHLDKFLEWVRFENIGGEKHPKKRN